MNGLMVPDFAPIDLTELQEQAELMNRVDRKYLLDEAEASALLRGLDPRTRILRIDSRQEFRYWSTYFDTTDLTSYRLAAHGRRRRFKVRTRSYLDSGVSFLEVKTKDPRGLTVKDRTDHDPADTAEIGPDDRGFVAERLAVHGLEPGLADQLLPVLSTGYRRITLLPPEAGVRVTVDTDLTWTDGDRGLSADGLVIVETKSGRRPSHVDRMLWRSGHRPGRVSKYGTCLAALRGDLPDNKWTRTLNHHFTTPEETPCNAA